MMESNEQAGIAAAETMKILLVYPTIGLSASYSCGVGYISRS